MEIIRTAPCCIIYATVYNNVHYDQSLQGTRFHALWFSVLCVFVFFFPMVVASLVDVPLHAAESVEELASEITLPVQRDVKLLSFAFPRRLQR